MSDKQKADKAIELIETALLSASTAYGLLSEMQGMALAVRTIDEAMAELEGAIVIISHKTN